MVKRLKQFFCRHLCCIRDIEYSGPSDAPKSTVGAPCLKCGKVLTAPYGLALNCKLVNWD